MSRAEQLRPGGEAEPWWTNAVLYQVYPRSFADSNGDGIGDLPGVVSRLDHLEWLGVDAIWLNPTFPSPNADWGYDVADYLGVHPDLGSVDDLDRLVAEALRRGIRVLLDLVPNHTSDRHEWFRDETRRHWYVWREGRGPESPPDDDLAAFGGPAWTFVPERESWYRHTFLPEQPDLDWHVHEVREAFDAVIEHWLDRGVAGFRVDVANALLRDVEGATPGAVEVHRRWRRLVAPRQDAPLLIGETNTPDLTTLCRYLVPDGLHLCMNFPFLRTPFDAASLSRTAAESERLLPPDATPVWHGSSHDDSRLATRWCAGDPGLVRCALVALLALRGVTILYQGDEIGLEAVEVPPERRLDVFDRDPCRTPMVWSDAPGAGFTEPGVEPWLPVGSRDRNVAGECADPDSLLHLTRDLITLRHRDVLAGPYEPIDSPFGVWGFLRGGKTLVALNLGDAPACIEGTAGTIVLCTDRSRDGAAVERVELGPREAAVVALDRVLGSDRTETVRVENREHRRMAVASSR